MCVDKFIQMNVTLKWIKMVPQFKFLSKTQNFKNCKIVDVVQGGAGTTTTYFNICMEFTLSYNDEQTNID